MVGKLPSLGKNGALRRNRVVTAAAFQEPLMVSKLFDQAVNNGAFDLGGGNPPAALCLVRSAAFSALA